MAILQTTTKKLELPDGSHIMLAAEELGVPFGCREGHCMTCHIDVVEGMENLSPKTREEIDLGCEGTGRQACQCRILGGSVTIQIPA